MIQPHIKAILPTAAGWLLKLENIDTLLPCFRGMRGYLL
jgi:hypothetical protein